MKIIDKFLRFLKTDRNTFATYILTLVTVYLAVDRIVEMLLKSLVRKNGRTTVNLFRLLKCFLAF